MEVARLLENKPIGKIYGLFGNINLTTNNDNYKIVSGYRFKNTVNEYLNSKKSIASLKMVMLDETYLNKLVEDLSDSEIKLINLAEALIQNKDYIILDYFDKGLNYKEKENFKRLFKHISKNYQKTIIIFTNDLTFIWDIASELIIVDKDEVINTINIKNIFDIILDINQPDLVKFTNLTNEKNINLDYYKNTNDLLKAIYRIKGD